LGWFKLPGFFVVANLVYSSGHNSLHPRCAHPPQIQPRPNDDDDLSFGFEAARRLLTTGAGCTGLIGAPLRTGMKMPGADLGTSAGQSLGGNMTSKADPKMQNPPSCEAGGRRKSGA
jgi:hypothetical protein